MHENQKVFSLEPIIDMNSQVLILGSMPGIESLEMKQYYANTRNHFWEILTDIFKKGDLQDYDSKILFLIEHKIALWDVINSCERIGSLDSNIRHEEPNDFQKIIESYPNIKLIAFNGGKSYDVFKKHIGFGPFPGIDFKRLPSTSPTPGKNVKSFEDKLKEWNIIQKYVIL